MKSAVLIVFLSILAWTVQHAYAQDKAFDYVYLKNGGMIKGRIMELLPTRSVKIRMIDGSIFVYDMDQVERLVFHSGDNAGTTSATNQTATGNLSLGGSLLYSQTFSGGSTTRLVNLIPSIGWFVADDFLLGLNVSYQGQTYTYSYFGYEYGSEWNWQLGIGPVLEAYFGSGLDKPFAGLSYLFTTSGNQPSHAVGFELGYSIHLSRNIALQPTIQYQLLAQYGQALGKTGELDVGVGLRDFIF